MTFLLMVGMLFFGILSYQKLPVSALPDIDPPVITIRAHKFGASPDVLSHTVLTPIERELTTISGVESMTAYAGSGYASITLVFDASQNIDIAAQEVQAALSRVQRSLPNDLDMPPTWFKSNPAQEPIIYLAITSDHLSSTDLFSLSKEVIVKQLSRLPGVSQVEPYGQTYAVRIQARPSSLDAYDLTLQDISRALLSKNLSLPSGFLDSSSKHWTIVAEDSLNSPEEVAELILAQRGEHFIRIKDVAEVKEGVKQENSLHLHANKEREREAVVVALQRRPGANTVKVSERVHQAIEDFKHTLPPETELSLVYDASVVVKEAVEEVQITLGLAIILVVLVIFFYLGRFRDTIIPALTIPLSLIGSVIAMYFMGYSIDTLSLLAMTLAVGFVVDDAIVVVENIVRYMEQGESPYDAALKGSKEIGFTILSMTLSLAAVFIPMAFLGGMLGMLFEEFAMTLMIAVLISGAVSMTLTPMLCSKLMKSEKKKEKDSWIKIFSDRFNNGMLKCYTPLLNWALKHPIWVLGSAFASVGLSVYLIGFLTIDFMPDDDLDYLRGSSFVESNLSFESALPRLSAVDSILKEDPDVKEFISLNSGGNWTFRFIRLQPRHLRSASALSIAERINTKAKPLPGSGAHFGTMPLMNFAIEDSQNGNYQYTLTGPNNQDLALATEALELAMNDLAEIKWTHSNSQKGERQLAITPIAAQAAKYSVPNTHIQETLQLAYGGGQAAKLEKGELEYPIIVELNPNYKKNLDSLEQLSVRSLNGSLVPLSSVASWTENLGPSGIYHRDGLPSSTISFDISEETTLDAATEAINKAAKALLPLEIRGKLEGTGEVYQEYQTRLWKLILLAVFVMYLVLGILYESLIHPITILSSLPFAGLGAVLTLWIFQEPLSLYGFVGVILLVGIVKKNGIMIVDYASELLRNDSSVTIKEAAYQACVRRFRPIMMTTAAAIIGALPLVMGIGGGSRQALGMVIIGGLGFSQILTLLLSPVLFVLFETIAQSRRTAKV